MYQAALGELNAAEVISVIRLHSYKDFDGKVSDYIKNVCAEYPDMVRELRDGIRAMRSRPDTTYDQHGSADLWYTQYCEKKPKL